MKKIIMYTGVLCLGFFLGLPLVGMNAPASDPNYQQSSDNIISNATNNKIVTIEKNELSNKELLNKIIPEAKSVRISINVSPQNNEQRMAGGQNSAGAGSVIGNSQIAVRPRQNALVAAPTVLGLFEQILKATGWGGTSAFGAGAVLTVYLIGKKAGLF